MSTSDSEYSIDWLASDEEDYDSPKTSSPRPVEELPSPPSSSSSTSSSSSSPSSSLLLLLSECPTGCFHRGAAQRSDHCCDCRDGGGCGGGGAVDDAPLQTPALGPLHGCTSACRATRKRTHHHHAVAAALDHRLCEKTQRDTESQLFSLKCTELQCYIQPLSSILRGLRSGRYSERLSSFQESVAMDRIQRIMGVLQNPNMGGRFLSIILKIEEMLQSWFPHIKPNPPQTDDSTTAKKRKQHHGSASPPPLCPVSVCSSHVQPVAASRRSSTRSSSSFSSHLMHSTTPPSTRSLHHHTSFSSSSSSSLMPPRCLQEVTQDSAVSSSTDRHPGGPTRRRHLRAHPHPRPSRGPLPFKIRSPCLERLLRATDSLITPQTVGD